MQTARGFEHRLALNGPVLLPRFQRIRRRGAYAQDAPAEGIEHHELKAMQRIAWQYFHADREEGIRFGNEDLLEVPGIILDDAIRSHWLERLPNHDRLQQLQVALLQFELAKD